MTATLSSTLHRLALGISDDSEIAHLTKFVMVIDEIEIEKEVRFPGHQVSLSRDSTTG